MPLMLCLPAIDNTMLRPQEILNAVKASDHEALQEMMLLDDFPRNTFWHLPREDESENLQADVDIEEGSNLPNEWVPVNLMTSLSLATMLTHTHQNNWQ